MFGAIDLALGPHCVLPAFQDLDHCDSSCITSYWTEIVWLALGHGFCVSTGR